MCTLTEAPEGSTDSGSVEVLFVCLVLNDASTLVGH